MAHYEKKKRKYQPSRLYATNISKHRDSWNKIVETQRMWGAKAGMEKMEEIDEDRRRRRLLKRKHRARMDEHEYDHKHSEKEESDSSTAAESQNCKRDRGRERGVELRKERKKDSVKEENKEENERQKFENASQGYTRKRHQKGRGFIKSESDEDSSSDNEYKLRYRQQQVRPMHM